MSENPPKRPLADMIKDLAAVLVARQDEFPTQPHAPAIHGCSLVVLAGVLTAIDRQPTEGATAHVLSRSAKTLRSIADSLDRTAASIATAGTVH